MCTHTPRLKSGGQEWRGRRWDREMFSFRIVWVTCLGMLTRRIERTRVMLGLGMLASVRTWSRIGAWKGGCCRQAASLWACNASRDSELTGSQLRGPDKKQTLGNILGMAFSGAQRGVRIEGDSMEGLRAGAFLNWDFERVSTSLNPLALPCLSASNNLITALFLFQSLHW